MSLFGINKFCLEKGVLIDKDVLRVFNEYDFESVKLVIEKILDLFDVKVISKSFFESDENLNKLFREFSGKDKKIIDEVIIGLNYEGNIKEGLKDLSSVGVVDGNQVLSKSIEVQDFVDYFNVRFDNMKEILEEKLSFEKLVSIGKVSFIRSGFSVIGMVYDKKVTKNKNIILEIEDKRDRMKVLINSNKPELYALAEEITLDSVLGFKGSGNKDILFCDEIIFPDSFISERKKSDVDEAVLFVGDLHYGSKRFLKDSFLRFIDYINSDDDEAKKIKYMFIVGDVVTGVGNYPNQEPDLEIVDLEEQFLGVAELLSKIRNDVNIIISPGNHDCVRLMEPQPVIDKKFAWPLYELPNVVMMNNPGVVNIGKNKDFSGFNVLFYHGFSFFYYTKNLSSLIKKKANLNPEVVMKYLLKNRHLAPTHASAQYFPGGSDAHFIKTSPDIFVAGHVHKSAVSYYNNILNVSVSCWEAMTPYMEKMGVVPDFCKVPMFNLKTRAVKILDFENKGGFAK